MSVYVIGRFLTVLACATETMRRQPIGIELADRNLPCFLLVKTLVTSQKNKKIMNCNPLDMFGTGTYTVKYDCQV